MMPADTAARGPFVAMFREEWRLAAAILGSGRWRASRSSMSLPAEQYLAPEFELFRQLFEANGIAALVADPAELSFDGERLVLSWAGPARRPGLQPADRLCPRRAAARALRAAYLADAVVLTPHPQTHALFADKRNLVASATTRGWHDRGRDDERTVAGEQHSAYRGSLPARPRPSGPSRKQWFFKPAAGFGSKATYRGDKLTRRVFAESRAAATSRRRWLPRRSGAC
jgi:hypothetical protein